MATRSTGRRMSIGDRTDTDWSAGRSFEGKDPDPELDEDDRTPKMSAAFERILSRTFAIDVLALSDELDGRLRLPVEPDRADWGSIANALAVASENARKAHLLYANAVVAAEEFEARVETTEASLRAEAMKSILALQADGRYPKKAVTNEDVRSEMARLHPDECERNAVKRAKVKRMVDQLQREAELHKHFPHSLEVILSTSRSP